MLRTRCAGLRWAIATLGLCAMMSSAASAGVIDLNSTTTPPSLQTDMLYATSGSIGTTGITGPNVISFIPEAAGAFTSPSAFSLGTFVVGYLPPGVSTTYDHTPFTLNYTTMKVNGTEPSKNGTPITITGFLNGTIYGPSQSSVVATFSPISNPSFITDNYLNNLSVLDPQVSLVPSTTNGGRTTAQGHLRVNAAPVPEPATIAVFATTLVGLALRRRFSRKSGAVQA